MDFLVTKSFLVLMGATIFAAYLAFTFIRPTKENNKES